MSDLHDEEPLDAPLRSRLGGGDQPTRAEAKVGLAVAAVLLALYGMWIWQPFSGDESGCRMQPGPPHGEESLVCPREPPEPLRLAP